MFAGKSLVLQIHGDVTKKGDSMMKLKGIKKLLLTAVMVITAAAFTGCGEAMESEVAFNADNTVNYSMSGGFDVETWQMIAAMSETTVDELMKQYEAQGAKVSEKVIDGLTYKMLTYAENNVSAEKAELTLSSGYEDVCLSSNYVYMVLDAGEISENLGDITQLSGTVDNYEYGSDTEMKYYSSLSLSFNAPVAATNGTIDPANPNHVTWVSTDASKKIVMYASTEAVIATAKTNAVKNNKYYKSNKTITVQNPESVAKMTIAKKSATDGTVLSPKNIKPGYVVKASAGYELKIWSKDGKCQTVSFTVDKKKPVISGAKDGKTYKKVTLKFSDSLSGVKSVTVNGKKVSAKKYNSYKITKPGKYKIIVTDKAGNQKKITIRIKK